MLLLAAAGCDEHPVRTACVDMTVEQRTAFAQKALIEFLALRAAGSQGKYLGSSGSPSYFVDLTGIRPAEVQFLDRIAVESDLAMEDFRFATSRTPGIRWYVSLYDEAFSADGVCPTKVVWREIENP